MTQKPWSRFGLVVAATVLAPLAAGTVRAQQPPNDTSFDVQLFQQSIGPHNFLTVDAPDIDRHKQVSFGLVLNYQLRAYVPFSQMPDQTNTLVTVNSNVVEHQVTAELAGSIALFERVQLGLALPYT